LRLAARFSPLALILAFASSVPSAAAQSSQAAAEWMLFDQILFIGIIVGIVVFGLMFYALIKYRERPAKQSAQ
jgi:heme/copper-type cytochrome/quinol oxidase subunit 2